LVVEREADDLVKAGIPKYRCLYRTPTWSQQAYEHGFDDPIVFGSYTDSFGLIWDLKSARDVRERFLAWNPSKALEIIWTGDPAAAATPVPFDTPLGIDIACKAPFWSIIADAGPEQVELLKRILNQNWLFDEAPNAQQYLSEYRGSHLGHSPLHLYLWTVYFVE
jgi:hypothetical protein